MSMKFHLHPVGKIVLYTIYPYYVEAVVARPAWGPTPILRCLGQDQ